ncbi:MAG: 3'(2'),5'-bisphosphate nucleotidase CysQ [Rickettsiales bacterium]
MVNKNDISYLIQLIDQAGTSALAFYKGDNTTTIKSDNSPVTKADIASHEVIHRGLSKFNLPVISEESTESHGIKSDRYWLIDPLDGTKEFINHSAEFTVNIALIEGNKPVFGIVSAPALKQIWYGGKGVGSHKLDSGQETKIICRPVNANNLVSLVSKSHSNKSDLEKFYKSNNLSDVIEKPAGSSLKICYIAEGKADIYPRLGPTMEWDIAAAQSVIENSGGFIYTESGAMKYGKKELLNPHFVASGFKRKYIF